MAAADKPAPTVTHLAAARASTIKDIAELQASLLKIDEQLIAQGAGVYQDEAGAHAFRVVAATEEKAGAVSYALPEDGEDSARNLSGDQFSKLFDRITIYKPTDGFELVAPKLLTPGKAGKLIELCQVTGKVTAAKKAYVKVA